MLTVALRVMADCAGDPAGLALLVDDVDHADAQSCMTCPRPRLQHYYGTAAACALHARVAPT